MFDGKAPKKEAIKPDFFSSLLFSHRSQSSEAGGPTEDERYLFGLSQTAGWRILRDDIDTYLRGLDDLNDQAIAQGASYEELGKNALVINLAKGVIKKILNRVDDAKEICERESGGTTG